MPSIKENKYFKKLIKVLFEPKTFFNETQSEVVYKQTFIFLLITLIFSLIISFIVDFIRYRTFVPSIYSAIVLTIVLFVTINLAALIGLFCRDLCLVFAGNWFGNTSEIVALESFVSLANTASARRGLNRCYGRLLCGIYVWICLIL